MESPSALDRPDKKKSSRKRKRRHKKGASEAPEASASEALTEFDNTDEVPF